MYKQNLYISICAMIVQCAFYIILLWCVAFYSIGYFFSCAAVTMQVFIYSKLHFWKQVLLLQK